MMNLEQRWADNGRRVVVAETNTPRFVEIGGEVVKLMTAPKPKSKKQKRKEFQTALDRQARRACGRVISKAHQERMWAAMAQGYNTNEQVLYALKHNLV